MIVDRKNAERTALAFATGTGFVSLLVSSFSGGSTAAITTLASITLAFLAFYFLAEFESFEILSLKVKLRRGVTAINQLALVVAKANYQLSAYNNMKYEDRRDLIRQTDDVLSSLNVDKTQIDELKRDFLFSMLSKMNNGYSYIIGECFRRGAMRLQEADFSNAVPGPISQANIDDLKMLWRNSTHLTERDDLSKIPPSFEIRGAIGHKYFTEDEIRISKSIAALTKDVSQDFISEGNLTPKSIDFLVSYCNYEHVQNKIVELFSTE